MAATRNPLAAQQRLQSWKEIAAFFDRDERTVKRWEKERRLPVHRMPGSARGGVFAYAEELTEWIEGRKQELELPETPVDALTEQSSSSSSQIVRLSSSAPSKQTIFRIGLWLVPLLLVGLAIFLSTANADFHFRPALAASRPLNPEAQDLYLKGRYYWNRRTPDSLNKAVDFFTQAIVRDPGYAPAFVGLADCYNLLREFSAMSSDEAFPRALAAAKKAVELDDTSAEAHNSLGFSTFYWEWDPIGAEREYKRALAINPNYVQGHHWYATFLLALGRNSEALDQIEQARQLDPSSAAILADKGIILHTAGFQNEGIALLKQVETTEPNLASSHRYLAEIYFARQDYANYFVESREFAASVHDDAAVAVETAAEEGFRTGGLRSMWEKMLPVQKQYLAQGKVSPYAVAVTCAQLGRRQEALQFLHVALAQKDMGMLFINAEPAFGALHQDPAYRELVSKVGTRTSS